MATINIPDKILDQIKNIVKDSDEFKDAEDYVNFVLEEVLKDDEEEEEHESRPDYSDEDEEKIKERLRGLGYL